MGCGRRTGKDELVRLAARALDEHGAPGSGVPPRLVVIDGDARAGGRGAYLCRDRDGEHPRAECLERAIRRGSIPRTLRARVTLDPKLVESVGR